MENQSISQVPRVNINTPEFIRKSQKSFYIKITDRKGRGSKKKEGDKDLPE